MLYFLVARLIWNFKPLVQLMCMDLCSVHPPHVFEIHGVSVQIRKRMRSRLNWDAFVNPRKVAVYKSHSGFMMNGEMETTWCWQSNMPLVALTRLSSSHKKHVFFWPSVRMLMLPPISGPSPAHWVGCPIFPDRSSSSNTGRSPTRRRRRRWMISLLAGIPRRTCKRFSNGMRNFHAFNFLVVTSNGNFQFLVTCDVKKCLLLWGDPTRKKISGAVKVCEADPKQLVRCASEIKPASWNQFELMKHWMYSTPSR